MTVTQKAQGIVNAAIEHSCHRDETVYLDYDEDVIDVLLADSDDSAETEHYLEFWGANDDADTPTTWSVYVRRATRGCAVE